MSGYDRIRETGNKMTRLITISWLANGVRRVAEKRAISDKLARIVCGSILTWRGPNYTVEELAIDGVPFVA